MRIHSIFYIIFAATLTLPSVAKTLPSVAKTTYFELVKSAQLVEVAETISASQITKSLPISILNMLDIKNAQAVFLLDKLDCLDVTEMTDIYINELTQQCPQLNPLTISHAGIESQLQNVLNTMLMDGIFEGYNIKQQINVTNFATAKELLLYGHENLVHAKQLLTLLTLNDVKYSWRLLPKTSAFNIRDGWNDAKDNEKQDRIRSSQEYDLQLTFANQQEKLKFMPLINQFAKRESEQQEGLIVNAWWQPFYRSFKAEESYQKVKRISFTSSSYVGSTLVLNKNYSSVMNKISSYLAKNPGDVLLSKEDVWVNPSFYRYLNGNFK